LAKAKDVDFYRRYWKHRDGGFFVCIRTLRSKNKNVGAKEPDSDGSRDAEEEDLTSSMSLDETATIVATMETQLEKRFPPWIHSLTTILDSLNLLITSGAAAKIGDVALVAAEAAWAAGTLLCDAGLSEHPYTMHACPVLLPVLCWTVVLE
jgi:hypothetical protein